MTIVYRVNGTEVSRDELLKRRTYHGGVKEMASARRSAALRTDTQHVFVSRSGLKPEEKEYVAKKARSLGLPEHSAYDPTIPGATVYETRAQADRQCAAAKVRAAKKQGQPEHRLHPRHVRNIMRAKIAQDPSLKRKNRRELAEEIIETHGAPL